MTTEAGPPTGPGGQVTSDRERPVFIQFQLAREEVVRSLRWRLLNRPRMYVVPSVAVASLALGAVLLSGSYYRQHRMGSLFVTFGVYLFLVFVLTLARAPGRSWRKNPELQAPQRMWFDGSGLSVESVMAQTHIRWAAYDTSFEYEGVYLLRIATRGTYHLVPRRAFGSIEDELTFRSLLERNTVAELRATA